MKEAAFGTYKDGRITFDEPDVCKNSSRVLVVFLDNESAKAADLFEALGPWEDTRNADLRIIDEKSAALNKEAEDALMYQESI
jgi:hypothetical protein